MIHSYIIEYNNNNIINYFGIRNILFLASFGTKTPEFRPQCIENTSQIFL